MPKEQLEKKYYLGIDLGGTKILSGLYNRELSFLGKNKKRTKAERGYKSVLERIVRCITELLDDFDVQLGEVAAVGIGSPGSITRDGKVVFAGNLGWKDVSLKKDLEEILKVPVFVENDCNIAALGIYHHELKGEPENMVGIFLGTGVGSGIIINSHLYRGSHMIAGEVGHMVIDLFGEKCNCGNRGCLEVYASRRTIFKKIDDAVCKGEDSILVDMVQSQGKDFSNLRSGDLLKAIRAGDKCVEKIINDVADYVGIAVANVINFLDPDAVMLGGGVIDALEDYIMPILIKRAREYTFPGIPQTLKIAASKLGDDAGITGGAVLALRSSLGKSC